MREDLLLRECVNESKGSGGNIARGIGKVAAAYGR